MRWVEKFDALEFRPKGHKGTCVIHRLAFRAILKISGPTASQCLLFAKKYKRYFEEAARTKINKAQFEADRRFHITSRDIRNSLRFNPAKTAEEEPCEGPDKGP